MLAAKWHEHTVAVQSFEAFYLSLFLADFPKSLKANSIEERRQLGAFPSQPIMVFFFCEGLKEMGNVTQVALTFILNLALTH